MTTEYRLLVKLFTLPSLAWVIRQLLVTIKACEPSLAAWEFQSHNIMGTMPMIASTLMVKLNAFNLHQKFLHDFAIGQAIRFLYRSYNPSRNPNFS